MGGGDVGMGGGAGVGGGKLGAGDGDVGGTGGLDGSEWDGNPGPRCVCQNRRVIVSQIRKSTRGFLVNVDSDD